MCWICTDELQAMGLDPSHLQLLPYTVVKWKCCIEGCTRGTFMHDYEIGPYYFSPRKGPRWGWMNVSTHWLLCGRHWKKYQAARKAQDGLNRKGPTGHPVGHGHPHVGKWHDPANWQQELILPTARKPVQPWQAIVPPGRKVE